MMKRSKHTKSSAQLLLNILKNYSKEVASMNKMNVYENLITIFLKKGHIFSRLDRPESANIEFNKAVEAYYMKASLFYSYGNFEKVIECCDEA